MIISGIDYSMTSPAICVFSGSEWSIKDCKFHYIVSRDKHLVVTDQLKGSLYPDWTVPEQRFNNLAEWSLSIMINESVEQAMLEGYSYSSTSSRIFNIGENTGILKNKMWSSKIPFDVAPPTVIKKFATGKGNANKEKMWDSFIEETGLNLFNVIGQEEKKNWNPVSDIVDSYYLAKYLYTKTVSGAIAK